MFRIRKKFRFEAAHQLEDAFSKDCVETIHGHSYVVELFLTSKELDEMGMVLDFGYLKEFVKLTKKKLDHALILHKSNEVEDKTVNHINQRKVVYTDKNPTAEFLAEMIFKGLEEFLECLIIPPTTAEVEKVRVHETESGWAEFERGKDENV